MQANLKSLVVSSVVFCATAAFAANHAKVTVPFAFSSEGQAYPAGSYDVALDTNMNSVTMSNNADASKHLSWGVTPADAAKAPAIVTFDHVGSAYVLKTIQVGERVTPVLDKGVQPSVSATTSISGQ
jgi:hypothetical protein